MGFKFKPLIISDYFVFEINKQVKDTHHLCNFGSSDTLSMPSGMTIYEVGKTGTKALTGSISGKIAWPIIMFGSMMQCEATMQQRAADGFESTGNAYRNSNAKQLGLSQGIYVIHNSFAGPYGNRGEYWDVYDVRTKMFLGSTGR